MAFGGNAENVHSKRAEPCDSQLTLTQATSTLSILAPFRRAFLRIPFLYQRISSTTAFTALIAPKAANMSMTVVHLDGTTDWMIAGQSLVAWSGQTLMVSPVVNRKMVCHECERAIRWLNKEVSCLLGRFRSNWARTTGSGRQRDDHPSAIARTRIIHCPSKVRLITITRKQAKSIQQRGRLFH